MPNAGGINVAAVFPSGRKALPSEWMRLHHQALERLADLLCEQETVDGSQIEAMLNQIENRDPVPQEAVETIR
jgi:hypothetical protein